MSRSGLRRFLGWVLVVAWVHRPTFGGLLHTVPDNPGDASFVMWTMSALKHQALHAPLHLFDGNSFLPHRGTLLYSDVLAGLAVPYGVLTAVQPNPVLALNLLHLGMAFAALEATYRLCRRHGVRPLLSAAGAIAFACSSFTLAHDGHVNLQAVAVFPVGVLLLLRVLDRPTIGRGTALGAFVAVVYLTVGYFALMLAVLLGAVAVAAVVGSWRGAGGSVASSLRRLAPAAATAVVVAALVAGPVVVAFLRTRSAAHLERRPDEVRVGRLIPSDHLVQGAAGSVVFGALDRTADEDPEHGLAPDLAMSLGIVVGVAAVVATRRRADGDAGEGGVVAGYVLAGAAGFWLALGPVPGMAGLAYRAAAKLVPGFATVRVPARLALLLLFAVCVLGAIGWERALRARGSSARRRGAAAVAVAVVVLAVVVAQATTTLPRFRVDDRSSTLAVYRLLADRPDGRVAVLPMREVLTTSGTLIEASRLQWSTIDDQPRFNGYSSFIPPEYEPRRAVLTTFPAPASLALLDDLDIRYVVLEHGLRSTLPVYTRIEVDTVLRSLPPGAAAAKAGEAYLVERPSAGRWSTP